MKKTTFEDWAEKHPLDMTPLLSRMLTRAQTDPAFRHALEAEFPQTILVEYGGRSARGLTNIAHFLREHGVPISTMY